MKTVPIVQPQDAKTYVELFSTAIARFQVAAITGGSAAWNAEGSEAMARLLLETAEKFDAHVIESKEAD